VLEDFLQERHLPQVQIVSKVNFGPSSLPPMLISPREETPMLSDQTLDTPSMSQIMSLTTESNWKSTDSTALQIRLGLLSKNDSCTNPFIDYFL
jgi:hypothetical protein